MKKKARELIDDIREAQKDPKFIAAVRKYIIKNERQKSTHR